MGLKQSIQWQLKIAAKILLSRLPLRYNFWRKLSLFKLGDMGRPEYALGVFRTHFERAQLARRVEGFVGLELGPGDSLFSALIAKAFGAKSLYLVDIAPFASGDLSSYKSMASFLRQQGFEVVELESCQTLEELLEICSALYLTEGLSSLRKIPTGSVDFVWSHAVMQNIRRNECFQILQELRRVQRVDGCGSHRVDLRDCLGGALNNLRFQEHTWESHFMSSSGFYTNRIRYTEMLKLFGQAGFEVKVVNVERWGEVPTPCRKMAEPFRSLPKEELTVSGFDVLLH